MSLLVYFSNCIRVCVIVHEKSWLAEAVAQSPPWRPQTLRVHLAHREMCFHLKPKPCPLFISLKLIGLQVFGRKLTEW